MSDLLVQKSAEMSECGTYRYRLTRRWGDAGLLPFVMLNPSTADAGVDDPTIRRCMSFARREGAGGIEVVNLYALRSVDPKNLWLHADPIGPDNEAVLASVVAHGPIVCAWGAHARDRGRIVARLLLDGGAHLVCLGRTKENHPRHPLYVSGNQPLVRFA